MSDQGPTTTNQDQLGTNHSPTVDQIENKKETDGDPPIGDPPGTDQEANQRTNGGAKRGTNQVLIKSPTLGPTDG